ncbi:MAG TPA: hypothetical protein VD963_07140 [Phycisphaerales bacterium]|nr:hypothetical protein [Phycisphaerales bacterium]
MPDPTRPAPLPADPASPTDTGVTPGERAALTMPAPVVVVRRRRRGRRVILWSLGALLLVLVVGVALLPQIASAIGPGIAGSAASGAIAGSVKVDRLSFSWGGPTVAGPVTLLDPQGGTVGTVTLRADAGLWDVISGRWWSAQRLDVGAVQVEGNLDIVRSVDGTTNLDRAIAPTGPEEEKSSGGPEQVRALVTVTDLDATFRDQSAPETSPTARGVGVRDLAGDLDIDWRTDGPSAISADLAAAVVSGGAVDSGAAPMKILADVKAGRTPAGALGQVEADVTVSGAPTAVADALGGFEGALARDVGHRADLVIDASGTPQSGTLTLQATADGAGADLAMAARDGVLSLERPGCVWARTTAFLSEAPGLDQPIEQAGARIRLEQAPAVEITLEKLRARLPGAGAPAAGGGPEAPAAGALAQMDLRGAEVLVRVRVSEMRGEVALPEQMAAAPAASPVPPPGTVSGPAPARGPGAAPPPAAAWRPFTIAATELVVESPDVAQGVRVTASSRATIDGQPAGDLAANLRAAGLLDEAGHLRPGLPPEYEGDVQVRGASTALLQPVVSGMNLPLDLATDVGRAVDLTVNAVAAGPVEPPAAPATAPAGLATVPRTKLYLTLKSDNLGVSAPLRLEGGVLQTRDEPAQLSMARTAPLLQRLLTPADGTPATVEVGGQGAVRVAVSDLAFPLSRPEGQSGGLRDVRANVGVNVADLSVRTLPAAAAPAVDGAPPPAVPASPVVITRLDLAMALPGEAGPTMTIDADLTHENAPFTLAGNLAAPGLLEAPPSSPPRPQGAGEPVPVSPIARLAQLRPTGRLALENLPESVLKLVPALAAPPGGPAPDDVPGQGKALVRGIVGPALDATVTLASPSAEATDLQATVAGPSLNLELAARLSPEAAEIGTLRGQATVEPADAAGLLAALTPAPAADTPGAAAAPGAPMRLAQAATLRLETQPVRLPLPLPGQAIDASRLGTIHARVTTERPLLIENVPVGTGAEALGVSDFTATAAIPGAVLARPGGANAEPVRVTATGDLLASGGARLGHLEASAELGVGGAARPPQFTVALTEVDTALADRLLAGDRGLAGAIGPTASLDIALLPETAAGEQKFRAVIQAPRLRTEPIEATLTDEWITLDKPATIRLEPDVAWLNEHFFTAPRPGAVPAPASPPPSPAPPSPARRPESAPVPGPQPPSPAPPPAADPGSQVIGRPRTQPPTPAPRPAPSPRDIISDVIPRLGDGAGATDTAPRAPRPRLAAIEPITLQIARLRLGRPAGATDPAGTQRGLFVPGYELDAEFAAPALTLATSAGGQPGQLRLADVRLATQTRENGVQALEFSAAASEQGSGAERSTLSAQLSNFATPTGAFSAPTATLNASGNLRAFPTAVIDALAGQGGLLTEALGPTVSATLNADRLSRQGGVLSAEATSERAGARLTGRVQDGAFVQTGAVQVNLSIVRRELAAYVTRALPTIASVEKTREDQPALLTAEGLTAPLDGDMRKLNGVITVDPGVARFETIGGLGQLLKLGGGRRQGVVGQRLEPFTLRAENGRLSYDRFRLALGEFDLETRGVVDLVSRQVDVITYVPLFALSDEVAGALNTNLSRVLPGAVDRATMVPIRTRGAIGATTTNVDMELFVREAGQGLIQSPEKAIDELLKGPIQDILKPRK